MSSTPKTLCYCVEIERGDGQYLGFTSLNHDLTIEGRLFKSNRAIDPTAVSLKSDLSTDNIEIKGFIDDESINPADIIAGVYRDARVTCALVDFVTLPATLNDAIVLITGRVGRITLTDSSYQFEIRSLSEILSRPIVKKYSPICPYIFGDAKCALDLTANGLLLTAVPVVDFSPPNTIVFNTTALTPNYIGGLLTFTTGNNALIPVEITAIGSNTTVAFNGTLPATIEVGDEATIKAACKKTQADCDAYGNSINFGGWRVGSNFMPGLERIAVVQ